MKPTSSQVVDYKSEDWATFPGGELEGKRPKGLCPACRAALDAQAAGQKRRHSPVLCFECYRADVARERALKAAGDLDTASEARFQTALPFEPVDRPRLTMLKAERAEARVNAKQGVGRFEDRRRQAQLAARHALQRIAAGLGVHSVGQAGNPARADHLRRMDAAIHAAELQLPESWLPFVVSR